MMLSPTRWLQVHQRQTIYCPPHTLGVKFECYCEITQFIMEAILVTHA